MGNLIQDESLHEKSMFITIKIERIKIEKVIDFYQTIFDRVTDLRIEREGFLHEEAEKRFLIRDKIHRMIEVNAKDHPHVFNSFEELYR